MKYTKFTFSIILILAFSATLFAQAKTNSKSVSREVKSSPAFAELLLRQTEVESELEEMLTSYTEEYPKIKDFRYELGVLQKSLDRISSVNPAEANKLTWALGKLLVRKARVETDYWLLKNRFDEKHPETMRAKQKLEIFERAIDKIMN